MEYIRTVDPDLCALQPLANLSHHFHHRPPTPRDLECENRGPIQVIRSAEDEVQMLLPHVKETEQVMQLFGREYLTFDVSLQRSQVLG